MPPPADQLSKFMNAIAKRESGGNYNAIGANTGSKYGVAQGKYQIMSGIWDGWAREAGYAGADWRDPRAQDAVAAYKMGQYYDRYDGDWGLVAAAWFSGIGNADKARDQGFNALAGVNDTFINVPTYVGDVLANMEAGPNDGPAVTPTGDGWSTTMRQPSAAQAAPPQEPMRQASDVSRGVLAAMARIVQASPDDPNVHDKVSESLQKVYRWPGDDDNVPSEVQ